MSTKLRIGSTRHEPVDALFDGRVTIDGVEAELHREPLASDVFHTMLDGGYDVAELGLTYFLRAYDTPESPFTALPIFPARSFRHSAMFVNTDAGIDGPRDLVGKTVGEFGLYGSDPGVWLKGILRDEYGVAPEQCRWLVGGTDHPIPAFDWAPMPRPENVHVRHAAEGQTLGAMLESGEIDALLSVDVPQALLDGSTEKIARLFPDYEDVERDYYRRTGIFPQMHLVAVRKELIDDTDTLRAIYRAFVESKELIQREYRQGAAKQHMELITPWFSSHFAENRALLGEDWWPYGLGANRTAIDTFLRYHHEQGLSRRLLTSDDIFAPAFLHT